MYRGLPCSTPLPAHSLRHARHGSALIVALLFLLLSWQPGTCTAEDTLQTEQRVKTAFLYNFARFVTWPEMPAGQFTLCVLGRDPLGQQLDTLLHKTVNERQLRVMYLNSMAMVDQCQLVFVSTSYRHKLHTVISLLREQPVLTVSDIDNFIASGGIIGFRLIDNKIRFEINTAAASTAGLSISSKLLTLATSVRAEE